MRQIVSISNHEHVCMTSPNTQLLKNTFSKTTPMEYKLVTMQTTLKLQTDPAVKWTKYLTEVHQLTIELECIRDRGLETWDNCGLERIEFPQGGHIIYCQVPPKTKIWMETCDTELKMTLLVISSVPKTKIRHIYSMAEQRVPNGDLEYAISFIVCLVR